MKHRPDPNQRSTWACWLKRRLQIASIRSLLPSCTSVSNPQIHQNNTPHSLCLFSSAYLCKLRDFCGQCSSCCSWIRSHQSVGPLPFPLEVSLVKVTFHLPKDQRILSDVGNCGAELKGKSPMLVLHVIICIYTII